jgi:hypothetical protein
MLTRERAPRRDGGYSPPPSNDTIGATLADQLHDLLALPEAALEHAMAERIRREDEMDEDARHRSTAERLHAWLELDPEEARIIARVFERASARLDSQVQARRIETERAVILNGMRFGEFRALAPLIGWLRYPPFDSDPGASLHPATEHAADAA